jgi:hypothetical protein
MKRFYLFIEMMINENDDTIMIVRYDNDDAIGDDNGYEYDDLPSSCCIYSHRSLIDRKDMMHLLPLLLSIALCMRITIIL